MENYMSTEEMKMYKKEALNLNEIVKIINLMGRTEWCDVDVNNIGIVNKVFNIKKSDIKYSFHDEDEVIIEITCSDNRKLYMDFKEFPCKSAKEDGKPFVNLKMAYALPNNRVLRFDADLTELYKKLNCTSLYEVLEKLTSNDLVEDDNLVPLDVTYSNNEITKSKIVSWDELKENKSTPNINDLNKAKFQGKELIHLSHFIEMRVDSIDNNRATEKINSILESLYAIL